MTGTSCKRNKPSGTGIPFRVVVLALMLPAAASAAEWALDPMVSGQVRFDDNLRMRVTDKLATTEVAIRPELAFFRATEVSEIRGEAALNFRRFDKDDEVNKLNTDDYFLKATSFYRTERQRWGLDLNFTKDTTLDSELEETGVVFSRVPRLIRALTPNWTYSLNERNNINLYYSYRQVRYDTGPVENYFFDYDNQVLSLGHRFSWTERTGFNTTLSVSRYHRDDDSYVSENGQFQIGVSHMFSERWSGQFTAGGRRTRNTVKAGVPICLGYIMPGFFFGKPGSVCVDRDTLLEIPFEITTKKDSTLSSGGVFSVGVQHRDETSSVAVNVSRNIVPSARYGLILTDRAGLDYEHSFSETLSASASLSWYSSNDTASDGDFLDREYIQFVPQLRWRLDRDWSLVGAYRYREQRYARRDTARGNAAWLTLRYGWPKIVVGR